MGIRAHPLYGTWILMIHRCDNPEHWAYKYYGARGIKVCDRWHDSRLFIEDIERDLGQRPDGMTLDRISADGDYGPGNVRWATKSEQRCNRRDFDAGRVHKVISRSGAGQSRADIARALDLNYNAVKAIVLRWHRGGYQGLEMPKGQPCETCDTWRPWSELEWHDGCDCGYVCWDTDVCDANFDRLNAIDRWVAMRSTSG